MSSANEWGEATVTGLSWFARINAVVGAVIGGIVALAFGGIGVVMLRINPSAQKKARARVESVEVLPNVTRAKLTFTPEGKSAPVTADTVWRGGGKPAVGQEVDVWYNVTMPDVGLEFSAPTSPKVVGWVFIAVALVIVAVIVLVLMLTFRSRKAAAVMGGLELYDLATERSFW